MTLFADPRRNIAQHPMYRTRDYTRYWQVRLTVLFAGFLSLSGFGLIKAAWWAAALIQVYSLLVLGSLYLFHLAPPRHCRVTQNDDGGIDVAPRAHLPLAGGVGLTTILVFSLQMTVYLRDDPIALLFGTAVGVCLVPCLPAYGLALVRRPHLRLTRDGLDYRGWSVDAALAWDDVSEVAPSRKSGFRAALVVGSREGAPSYAWRRRRLPLNLEHRPRPGEIEIPLLALDSPPTVLRLLRELALTPAHRREHLLTPDGVARLRASDPRPG